MKFPEPGQAGRWALGRLMMRPPFVPKDWQMHRAAGVGLFFSCSKSEPRPPTSAGCSTCCVKWWWRAAWGYLYSVHFTPGRISKIFFE